MHILFLAAEAEPFIKIGGLGDVAGSLPRALRALNPESTSGITPDVRLVLPFHQAIRAGPHDFRPTRVFTLAHGSTTTSVRVLESELHGMPVYFLDAPPISAGGSVYASDSTMDVAKYLFFSMAALELARALNWPVDILHANDWHTALAAYAMHLRKRSVATIASASVLTVHNLAFVGPEMPDQLVDYGLQAARTGLPEWAAQRPLPLGLWAADAVVAVSPSYAREIQTRKFGAGLNEYLRARRESLHGILNGIDTDSFNPATDPDLEMNYGAPTLDRRTANKRALQARLGLPQDGRVLTFGLVSRLDIQKGIDLLPTALRRMRDLGWQLICLGIGQPALEQALRRLQNDFPDRVRIEIGYDAQLARQIYAGADALVMPSRYEPCGLAQMIAMRYGCIPVVSAVGGLIDTVADGITGIVMGAPTVGRLVAALSRTVRLHEDGDNWLSMQRAAMAQDFSWTTSARKYFELYRGLLSDAAGTPVA